MAIDKTAEFIELYNRLEGAIREAYDVPRDVGAVAWLVRNERGFRAIRDDLNYCREVRNFLQHNERVDGEYAVVPSDAMLRSIKQTIERIENVAVALYLCVRTADIRSACMKDLVLPAMRDMSSGGYTHIPILEDGRVVGAFSENTLLSHIIKNGVVGFEDEDTFEVVQELLPLDRHDSERFAFVAADAPATEVAELFQRRLRKSQRLGMAFVTAHGKREERLLGILTAWDLAEFF